MVHEQLSRARTLRGEDVKALASRTGLREGVIRAIEDGRFDALPRGIYARAAIKTYASAMGFDAEEILQACAASLPAVEEPIRAMGRLRGVRQRPIAAPEATPGAPRAAPAAETPNWRLPAAAAIDACVVGAMLVALITVARIAIDVPVATLGRAGAVAFAVMGVVMAVAYFAWFGGLSGATAGERALHLDGGAPRTACATLAVIIGRAMRCATDDLRFVAASGAHCRQAWNTLVLAAPPAATACSSAPRDL